MRYTDGKSNFKDILQKSSFSAIAKLTGWGVWILVSIILGRSMGATSLGVIYICIQVVSILMVGVMVGFESAIVKLIAIDFDYKNFTSINSTITGSLFFNGLLSIFVAAIGYTMSSRIAIDVFQNLSISYPLQIFFLSIPFITLNRVIVSSLSGIHKIWQSNLLNESFHFIIIGLLVLITPNSELTVNRIANFFFIGRVITLLVAIVFGKYSFSAFQLTKHFELRTIIKIGLPILVVNSTIILSTSGDSLMLGWLGSIKDVGIYSVAARLALLLSFFLAITNSSLGPKIASLYNQNEIGEISVLFQKITQILFFIGIIFLIAYIVGGKILLGLWGAEFVTGYSILLILTVGQFVNISTGCVGLILIMCGYEKLHGKISIAFVLLNLVLNLILIPIHGALGAAFSTSLTVIIENLVKMFFVRNKLGISII